MSTTTSLLATPAPGRGGAAAADHAAASGSGWRSRGAVVAGVAGRASRVQNPNDDAPGLPVRLRVPAMTAPQPDGGAPSRVRSSSCRRARLASPPAPNTTRWCCSTCAASGPLGAPVARIRLSRQGLADPHRRRHARPGRLPRRLLRPGRRQRGDRHRRGARRGRLRARQRQRDRPGARGRRDQRARRRCSSARSPRTAAPPTRARTRGGEDAGGDRREAARTPTRPTPGPTRRRTPTRTRAPTRRRCGRRRRARRGRPTPDDDATAASAT